MENDIFEKDLHTSMGTKVFVNALELENERGSFTQLLNIPNFIGIW